MKELILDGFFRCAGCGRRYHLEDALESEAVCDECGGSLEPEMDDTDDEKEEVR
jgi:rRNA maturation endonuclease Nob1